MALISAACDGQSKSLDNLLKRYNNGSVPYITVEQLKADFEKYTVLDTRTREEYEVSHIPNAIWVGESFDSSDVVSLFHTQVGNKPRELPIVVYCTVGVRSENYAEKLKKHGFEEVKNLHGSIISWSNAGYRLQGPDGNTTDKVHTYSRSWSKYLKKGIAVY